MAHSPFSLLLAAAVGAVGVGLAAEPATIETAALRVRIESGQPVALENRLTGESLAGAPVADAVGLVWQQNPVWAPAGEGLVVTAEPGQVTSRFTAADNTACRTVLRADAASGELVVTQSGTSDRGGLYAVQWAIGGLPSEAVTLIVPGQSGVAFGAGAPFSSLSFDWPMGWEAGMLLLQMKQGGFLVWADDPAMTFKALHLGHRDARFTVKLQSHNHAPFAACRSIDSVTWRVRAYRGDWRAGAEVYRAWLAATARPTLLAEQKPAWVRDTCFVAIVPVEVDLLEPLARQVVPERTLLYVPGWRRDSYDKNYPDYTAADRFPAFVEAAHRLGFRVMPHVNYFGCDPKNPVYERFEKVQFVNPFNHEREWWTWPFELAPGREPDIKFAYIHPGSREWRELIVARFREIVERYHVDALHLDQTLCITNHDGGPVDGLTAPQGNRQLHQDLRAALPEVAISGEGLDEVTLPYEAFAQRHAGAGVDHVHGTWNDTAIAYGHPISSYLFLPYNTIYGYLGMANPSAQGLYHAWRRAYEPWGVIPTLAHPSARQLQDPSGAVAMLLAEAGVWTGHRLQPDFAGDWGPLVRFRWRGEDGVSAVVERTPTGASRLTATSPGEGAHELYRYIRGVNRYQAPGQIVGWLAYDSDSLFGLDPVQTYLYDDQARDPRTPHLSALPPDSVLTGTRLMESGLAVSVGDPRSERFVDIGRRVGEARTGVAVNGADSPLERGAGFEASGAVAAGVLRQAAIFAHPPWHRQTAVPAGTPLGETYGEFTVDLPPNRGAELAFGIALRDGVGQHSDGATFRVAVDGQVVFEKHQPEGGWADQLVDLSRFAGRQIRLRLITTPGPQDDPTFDWAVWGDPVVRLRPDPQPQTFAVTLPQPVRAILAGGRALPLPQPTRAGDLLTYTVQMPLPATALFLWGAPARVTCPVDLAATPFTVAATVAGQSLRLPVQYVDCRPGTGVSKGEERRGLAAHPPNAGCTYADYLLDLPAAAALTLRCAVALQDGSTSDACGFRIEANGRELAHLVLNGPDGWHPLSADLTPFAGGPVLLSLVTDSEGPFSFDWARWAEPVIEAKP